MLLQIKHWLWFLEFLFCFKIYFCMGAHLSKPWIYLYNVQVMAILKLCLPIFATIFKSWTFGICSRVWKNLAFREKIENVEDGCKYYSVLAESIWAIPQDFTFTAYKFSAANLSSKFTSSIQPRSSAIRPICLFSENGCNPLCFVVGWANLIMLKSHHVLWLCGDTFHYITVWVLFCVFFAVKLTSYQSRILKQKYQGDEN